MNNVKICDHSKNTEIVSKGERLWNIMPIKQATFGGSWTMYWYAGWTRWLRWTTKISWRYSSVLRLCSYSGWILRREREFLHLDFWMDRVEENLGITGFLGSENRKSHCLFVLMREVKGICFSKKLKNIEILWDFFFVILWKINHRKDNMYE